MSRIELDMKDQVVIDLMKRSKEELIKKIFQLEDELYEELNRNTRLKETMKSMHYAKDGEDD
jgi:hypothetical protein